MEVVAPISKFKMNNLVIFIVAFLGMGGWFAYDGYFNEEYKTEHTLEDGTFDGNLEFNRKAPPFFVAGALAIGAYFLVIKNKKIVADDEGLVVSGQRIAYDAVEKLNKTHFEKKGYFILTYKSGEGEKELKISDRKYDGLEAVLDVIVAKIS